MRLEREDINEFLASNAALEIELKVCDLSDEYDINLYSYKLNISVEIMDLEDGYAQDNAIYIDYAYLEDGMKAWQVQYNSNFLDQSGFIVLKKLLAKFFHNELVLADYKMIKPLRTGCNFDNDSSAS